MKNWHILKTSRSQLLFKIGALKNLALFTGVLLCMLQTFNNSFFIEHLWWLLLFISRFSDQQSLWKSNYSKGVFRTLLNISDWEFCKTLHLRCLTGSKYASVYNRFPEIYCKSRDTLGPCGTSMMDLLGRKVNDFRLFIKDVWQYHCTK